MATGDRLGFTKMQGVGNDMIVVDARGGLDLPWADVAVRLCERRLGVGADGLLVIEEAPGADAAMRMHNPDGTPDFCGNGLRCVARYVAERGAGAPAGGGQRDLRIATLRGIVEAQVRWDATGECRIAVDMGEPRFAPADIPMRADGDRFVQRPLQVDGGDLTVTALSTGSTHTVMFVDELPPDEVFFGVSPLVENHALFPERTSLMWARVDSSARLSLRIWERGAGETLGCGTGACAAAVASQVAGLTGEEVVVTSPGGELTISWAEGRAMLMSGPAEYVFEGELAL